MCRLFLKRALVFYGFHDVTILRDGSSCQSSEWNTVADDGSDNKLTLQEYLTYDEMCISSLIGICSPTYFINNGNRNNCGSLMDLNEEDGIDAFERFGYYAGLVGARFERKDRMESRFILVQPEFNTKNNGFGELASQTTHVFSLLALWANFYFSEDTAWCNNSDTSDLFRNSDSMKHFFPLFEDVERFVSQNPNQSRYYLHQKNKYVKPLYFDIDIYKRRIELV